MEEFKGMWERVKRTLPDELLDAPAQLAASEPEVAGVERDLMQSLGCNLATVRELLKPHGLHIVSGAEIRTALARAEAQLRAAHELLLRATLHQPDAKWADDARAWIKADLEALRG